MANALTTVLPLGLNFNLPTTNAGQILFQVAPGGAGGVTSVFGRTGDVVAQSGDYSSSQITDLSAAPGATVTDALNATGPAKAAGANLTDASVTLTPTGIGRYTANANTFVTIARSLTLDPAGFTNTQAVEFAFDAQTVNVNFINGGPAGGTIFTIPAGSKMSVYFMKDAGGNVYVDRAWFIAGAAA